MTTVDRAPDRAPPDLDAVFRRHADRLWSVAVRMLGDRTEAEDAVQEAFLSALRSPGFRGEAEIGTWLHRIVVNACVDRIRAAGRHRDRTRSLRPAGPDRDHAGRLVARLTVERALTLLPAEQRAAVVLVHALGHGVGEAAEILEVRPGTVKSRCARGRARLAELLREEEP
ncbi:sigma-70 family RNA polymerase sigma factor [Pseudonocardia spirodelae]|uniref:Sigma-70 family RNA polymerase sigma factor n=1 Tax=Pseudonocardia spirodelae TaxID=3133431 RepID=A0ABU8TCN4_9PSEU